MRTITFQSVLYGVVRALGYDPARDLTAARAGTLCEYINQRVIEGWKFDFFPEWTVTEQRLYRAVYASATAYTATTEVYFYPTTQYYQALQASTGQAPALLQADGVTYYENGAYWALSAATYSASPWQPGIAYGVNSASNQLPYQVQNPNDGLCYQCIAAHTSGSSFDATKWGVLTPLDKYVGYDQTGLTAIGEVKLAARRNPKVRTNNPGYLDFVPSDNGVQFDWRAPNVVWLQFRRRPPVFTTTLYSSGTAYAAGVTVYDANGTGDCWTTTATTTAGQSPTSTPAKWSKVQFPAILGNFVKRAALSDALRDQKQTDRAAEELTEAYAELQDVQDRELAGQGQFDTASAQVYGGGPARTGHWGRNC